MLIASLLVNWSYYQRSAYRVVSPGAGRWNRHGSAVAGKPVRENANSRPSDYVSTEFQTHHRPWFPFGACIADRAGGCRPYAHGGDQSSHGADLPQAQCQNRPVAVDAEYRTRAFP